MDYCLYYQARVERKLVWFMVAILRSYEHMAFDRTIDKEQSIFEFFVPNSMKKQFEQLMGYFVDQGIVTDLQEMENRLLKPGQEV